MSMSSITLTIICSLKSLLLRLDKEWHKWWHNEMKERVQNDLSIKAKNGNSKNSNSIDWFTKCQKYNLFGRSLP